MASDRVGVKLWEASVRSNWTNPTRGGGARILDGHGLRCALALAGRFSLKPAASACHRFGFLGRGRVGPFLVRVDKIFLPKICSCNPSYYFGKKFYGIESVQERALRGPDPGTRTATDTAKVSAERANPALRILPDSSSRIISMSYADFPCPLRRYVCVFLTVK